MLVAPGLPVRVAACLGYHRGDPYAVRLDCHVDSAVPVRWTFGRELPRGGCSRPCGSGDVSVEPGRPGDSDLVITLRGAGGAARLRTPLAPVREFLERTHRLVAAGTESTHLRIDEVIDVLLGRTPPDRI
ncbi:SsgA family sporulation/cell division regulator [Kitasatospora sp. NPDC101801]|uniref:SsgA family sporulation/cell division regulator n=1 Tax=Kitasatospora sp. NPDC101801 TaxID=3364103 RepID=UPI00380032B1